MKITEWMKEINKIDETIVLGVLNNRKGNLAREFAHIVYHEEKEREQKKEPYKRVTYYMDKLGISEVSVHTRLDLSLRDITNITAELEKGNDFFKGSGIDSRTFNILIRWKRQNRIPSENFALALLGDVVANKGNTIRKTRGCGLKTYKIILKELERYFERDLQEFAMEDLNKYYYSR